MKNFKIISDGYNMEVLLIDTEKSKLQRITKKDLSFALLCDSMTEEERIACTILALNDSRVDLATLFICLFNYDDKKDDKNVFLFSKSKIVIYENKYYYFNEKEMIKIDSMYSLLKTILTDFRDSPIVKDLCRQRELTEKEYEVISQ